MSDFWSGIGARNGAFGTYYGAVAVIAEFENLIDANGWGAAVVVVGLPEVSE